MDKEGILQQGQSQGSSPVWVDLAFILSCSLRDDPLAGLVCCSVLFNSVLQADKLISPEDGILGPEP